MHAGLGQALRVAFSPSDPVRYSEATAMVTIDVRRFTPGIAWESPPEINYGTSLDLSQLNAIVPSGIDGVFSYVPMAGTMLNAGDNQSLRVDFTPLSVNYESASRTVTINVAKTPLTIAAIDQQRVPGVDNPVFNATYSGLVNGDVPADLANAQLTTEATKESPPGEYPIAVSSAADNNYSITSLDGILTVLPKEIPTLTWVAPSPITYGTPLSVQQLNASTDVIGVFRFFPPDGTVLTAGEAQMLEVEFIPDDLTRYDSVHGNVKIDVRKAPLFITASNALRNTNTPNPEFFVEYSGFVNGDTEASLDAAVNLSSSATELSPAGSYPIIAGDATDPNYAITFLAGSLTIVAVDVPSAEGAATILYRRQEDNKRVFALSWPSILNQRYRIERSGDLREWSPLELEGPLSSIVALSELTEIEITTNINEKDAYVRIVAILVEP